ncbi:MAG TPA: TIGR03960 family B12-binding radical SAM protein [Polyangiales bacterium]|nr:TIGR03960 family B12-binding radical SAM protein [Polyangiales bacterium]
MSDTRQHPYTDFIHRVKKPARYLGGEHGEIVKDWQTTFAKVCLCFPDVYEVGMSHLGFKILYSILNKHPKLLAERAYAPWIDMEQELRARGEPLRSLESFRALSEFDVVGFSLQFELTFTNILQMLELGGIPLRSCERQDDQPLVLAGGPTATHPEPLSAFVDAVLIGDGEERTPEIALLWTELRAAGVPRAERLARLAQLPGVYVPSLYTTEVDAETGQQYVVRAPACEVPLPVQRTFLQDISQYPFPKDGPIANTETVFDRVSVEIARGCTEGCRFCQAGMIYRPVRERDPAEIIDVLRHAVKDGGYDGASLTSLSTADYSAISPLVHSAMVELREQRATLSVSSLRAYGLDEDVLDEIKDGGGKGLTFAPEAGTQRMRDVINKNVTEEQLLETARRVFSRGFSRMKLYFMIGLPTETDEDVLGIVATGARALAVGRELIGRAARVTVSVSTHVPKPHTPFQWCAMDARDEVLRKQQLLRDAARRAGVELKMHDSLGSFLEGVIARGDRSLCEVIYGAYKRGARFDSWEEQLRLDYWQEAMADAGVDPARFLGTLPVTAKLPWQHIDVSLAPGFLAREYRKALRDRLSPPCGKAVGMFVHHTNLEDHERDRRKLVCYDCGVACDLDRMRSERADFLVKLGAKHAPVAPHVQTTQTTETTEAAQPEEAAQPSPRRARPRPPERPDQGQALRVRLGYRKLGRAAFSSHLDLVRLLPRLFRRLQLPVYYSLGFHSKPVLVFGPALSLGVASLAEYVDLKLAARDDVDWQALPARLSEAALDGLDFFAARRLGDRDPKLSQLIHEAGYVAGIPRAALAELGFADELQLAATVAERSRGELRTRRVIDGVGKWVDVHRYLAQVAVGEGAELLASAGVVGDLIPIQFRLAITEQGSAKASEVLETLLDRREVPARIVRTGLGWRTPADSGTPLELERYRSAHAPADAVPATSQ